VIHRLAIVGLGLLGGSVAKGARAAGMARHIVGVGRNPGRLAPALADGGVDEVTTDLARGVAGADFVVLAAPVATIESMLEEVWRAVGRDAVVTDVGSTKAAIARRAAELARQRPFGFVGSHPMAGSEQSGYAVARADLFRGATVIVTPDDTTAPGVVKGVSGFWERLGAGRVLSLEPEVHDRAVAAISHVPHLVACALVDAVQRADPEAFALAAGGFRDTTRIAAGDPEMWLQIFLANRTAVAAGVRDLRAALDDLLGLMQAGDADGLRAALARIKGRRESLR
jgi:3-phosphoshikimate 1-carboxyvinyltransferase